MISARLRWSRRWIGSWLLLLAVLLAAPTPGAAQGQRSLMGQVAAGSLGTAYGEIRQTIRPASGAPKQQQRPRKVRTYYYARPSKAPPAVIAEVPLPKIDREDSARLARAEKLVGQARQEPITALIDPEATAYGGFVVPLANSLFERKGGTVKLVENRDMARIGLTVAKSSLAAQVGVLGHESQHARQEDLFRDPGERLSHESYAFSAGGADLPAAVSRLLEADFRRFTEREADAAGGQILATARRQTGDAQLTPKDMVPLLHAPPKVPFRNTWFPGSHYDRRQDRVRTLWQAYGPGLKEGR